VRHSAANTIKRIRCIVPSLRAALQSVVRFRFC
jgi:hypothetical protein